MKGISRLSSKFERQKSLITVETFFFFLTELLKQSNCIIANTIIPISCEHASKWKFFSAALIAASCHGICDYVCM